jgi:hypothetical protein
MTKTSINKALLKQTQWSYMAVSPTVPNTSLHITFGDMYQSQTQLLFQRVLEQHREDRSHERVMIQLAREHIHPHASSVRDGMER